MGINNKHFSILACLLVIASFIIYWPVLSYEFINFDDPIYVVDNTNIQHGFSWPYIQWAFTSFHAGNWHPLTWLSHNLDWKLYNNFAGSHHRTNLIFHSVNSLLLFTFLSRATLLIWPSFICAFLFAIHPIHIESVAWVSERKDVLCAFFIFLSLLTYLKWTKFRKLFYFILTHLLLICALLSKPMAVTFPLLLLIIDFWPLQRNTTSHGKNPPETFKLLVKEKSLMIIFCGISSILTFLAQQSVGAVKLISVIPISDRIANALSSYIQYILKILWPTKLAIFYPFHHDISILLPITTLILLIFFIFWFKKLSTEFPFVISGTLWFTLSLVPVIGIIQVGNQAHADRYMYIPAIGLYIILAWGIENLRNLRLKKFATLTLCVPLIILPYISRNQVYKWSDSITLFSYSISVTKNNDTAYTYLANSYRENGQSELATEQYKNALEINSKNIEALINLGVLSAGKDIVEAKNIFKRAITLYPQHPEAHNNLANILKQEGEFKQAIDHYEIAIQNDSNYQNALFNLASTYDTLGNHDKALELYKQCLELNVTFAEAYNGLGVVLAKKGDLHNAVNHFNKAISIRADYKSAQQNLIKAQGLIQNLLPE